MADANVLEFTDTNFASEVLQSNIPVLVDFWAPWCAPCRQILPMIDQLAAENAGSIKVGKMNIDDNPSIPNSYNVSGVPTLLIFKNGEVISHLRGAQPKSRMQAEIDAAKG